MAKIIQDNNYIFRSIGNNIINKIYNIKCFMLVLNVLIFTRKLRINLKYSKIIRINLFLNFQIYIKQ